MLFALSRIAHRFSRLGVLVLLAAAALPLAAQTDQAIYTDALQNNWQDWGWAPHNYNNTAAGTVHSGTASVSVTISDTTYQGLYLAHSGFDSSPYTSLSFWIYGGSPGGQKLQVVGHANGTQQSATNLPPLAANTWQQFIIPLSTLGVAGVPSLDGFYFQDRIGAVQPTFYLDDITLVANATPPPGTNAPVTIVVDAALNAHPISPLIYGVAFATSNEVSDLNCPLNRSGGNSETRYNWLLNAHNHAADWYFESLADSPATPGAAADAHIAHSKNGGAQPMVTIPMIGWMPRLGANRGRLASYSIAKYGLQTGNDWQWFSDAGTGIITNTTTAITTNNPNDANFPTNSAFQRAWVSYLTNRWGVATNGGVRYYLMDNEHTLWHSTHQDVHPVGTTMQEIRDRFFEYAGMVKSLDPDALVLAPEEWGWPGYFYSGYDQQWSGANRNWNPAQFPDRGTNGGWDYVPWLLDQFRQRAATNHQRLLDVLTVHIYPQGGESGSDTSTATQLLRNRSTRSLWDTNYVDASWINAVVKLIPRLKDWVAQFYPGTRIGITEYNWGAENHINGATAQADILGIFGREGLDLATRWTTPPTNSPTFLAMKLYRNYDGRKSTFGDVSVAATGANPDNLASFAATRSSDSALTVMLVNKQLTGVTPATLTLTHFLPAGTAQVWQLTAANVITRLADLAFTGGRLTNALPPRSVTLLVLPAGMPARLAPGQLSATNTFDLWLTGQAGQRYALESSADLVNWQPVQTNTAAASPQHLVLPAPTGLRRFYRSVWLP